jgi:hypothetical protein
MHAQRRCGGGRRSDGAGICGQFGAEPAKPDGSTEIGSLSCASSPTSLHRQIGWRQTCVRYSVFRGQSSAAGHRDAAGADLRAGFSGLLIWLSVWSQCASSVTSHTSRDHEAERSMGGGSRHSKILRQHRSRQAARTAGQTNHGRCSPKDDRQVVESGRAGAGAVILSRHRHASGWCYHSPYAKGNFVRPAGFGANPASAGRYFAVAQTGRGCYGGW